MTERLGPATTGVAKTTVGSVTFDAAVHATYHGAESRIFLCNASGHPIAATPVHGAAALIRAYGAWKDDVDQEKYQSKLRLVYMDNIIGHALRKDRRFRSVGVMNIVHTMRYADFKHAWD